MHKRTVLLQHAARLPFSLLESRVEGCLGCIGELRCFSMLLA